METNKPKRGRKRTPASIAARLTKIDEQMAASDPLKRLKLNQEKMDLQSELKTMSVKVDLSSLEKEFVAAAASYSKRQNISYEAWRLSGVSAETLKKAGISLTAAPAAFSRLRSIPTPSLDPKSSWEAFGMRHEPDDIALGRADASDVVH